MDHGHPGQVVAVEAVEVAAVAVAELAAHVWLQAAA